MTESSTTQPLGTLLIQTDWFHIQWPDLPNPAPSRISLDGIAITPFSSAATPAGWQMVVLDSQDGNRVVFNEYVTLLAQQGGMGNHQQMYTDMYNALTQQGFTAPRHVLVLAGFCVDSNMLPTAPLFDFLLNAGAGKELFNRQSHCDPAARWATRTRGSAATGSTSRWATPARAREPAWRCTRRRAPP